MKKPCTTFCYSIKIILIFGVNHVISGGNSQEGTSEKIEETSVKVLPIILLKESKPNILEIPNDVTFDSGFCFWKRVSFHANTGLHERFFCGADATEQKKIQDARKEVSNTRPLNHVVSENCLFEKPTLRLITSFPITPNCTNEPEPFIFQLFEPEKKIPEDGDNYNKLHFHWSSCGPAPQERKLYRFGYQLWMDSTLFNLSTQLVPPLTKSMAHPYKNTVDYEIYRFCYDDSVQELLYTKHRILSPALLSNENLKEGPKTYDIEISNYGNSNLDFKNIKKIYDQVVQVNKSNIENIPIVDQDTHETPGMSNLMHYKMEKLVPDEDLAFILWKKPTFHYVNYHLMHKALLKPWNEINEILREQMSELDIYTGVFDISTKTEKNKTAKTTQEIKIPEVWIKIVQCSLCVPKDEINLNDGIAIIANNHMDHDLEKTISEYCGNTNMHQYYSREDEALGKKEYSFIRCCSVTSKIENLFGLDLKITHSFELPQFVTSIYAT